MGEKRRLAGQPLELRAACIIAAAQIVASSKSGADLRESAAKSVAVFAVDLLSAFDQEFQERTDRSKGD